MNKNWNVIPIQRNSKIPAIKWLEYKEKQFPQKDLDLYKTLNRAVICGSTSNNLVILDFDFEERPYFKNILNIIRDLKTHIVTTPHGLHIYFYIDGEIPPRQTQIKAKLPELKAFDILGEGGYALIPPSTINDEFYMAINKYTPKKITREYFDKLVQIFSEEKKESVVSKYVNNLKDLRKPIQQLIKGEMDIEEVAAETGEKEFLYWKAIFLETRANNIPDEIVMGMLASSQTHFDQQKTTIQLRQIKKDTKPFTNKTLNKLFKTKMEIPKKKLDEDEWVSIARDLREFYDVISMADTRQLMVKRGNIYTDDMAEFYKDLAEQIVDMYKGKSFKHKRSAVLQLIEDITKFDRNNFSYDRWIINFTNGYFDIRKNKFFTAEENTDKIFCYEIPHEYNEGKYDCPVFKKLLLEWLGDKNIAKPEDVFEMIGYTMTMTTHLKMAFMVYGKSNSGKTAFQNILSNMIGIKNISGTPLHRFGSNEFGTDNLQFKILNMVGDMGETVVNDVAIFKNLTGGDIWVHAEYKGGKKFEFRNMVKIWYNVNYIPKIKNKHDEAFFTRWMLINFPNKFPLQSKNTIKEVWDLINENPDEIQGIIHESIKGAQRLISRNEYFRPALIKNTEHVWEYESDSLYAFIYDNCVKDLEEVIPSGEFRMAYNKYLYGLRRPQITSHKLSTELETIGVFKERSTSDDREYYYKGLGWKPKKKVGQTTL